MAPDHFNDDAQQHYLDELKELLISGNSSDISNDHVQALIAEKKTHQEFTIFNACL